MTLVAGILTKLLLECLIAIAEPAADGNNELGVSGVSQSAQMMILKVVDTEQQSYGSAFGALEAWAYGVRHGARVLLNRWACRTLLGVHRHPCSHVLQCPASDSITWPWGW